MPKTVGRILFNTCTIAAKWLEVPDQGIKR